MWSAYAEDDPSRPTETTETSIPGLTPPPPACIDPVRLLVNGEHFVVTPRASSPGTYDFTWTSHPASYGFTLSANSEWRPDRIEMTEEIRSFLSQIDDETGYLPD
jgi:hypothetical protein